MQRIARGTLRALKPLLLGGVLWAFPPPALPQAPRETPPAPAILYGPFHLPDNGFGPPFTATLRNGNNPKEVLRFLDEARAAHIHVILNMFVNRKHITNPDGSFNLERWKDRVDRFRNAGLEPYIADGTLVGNYLLDEPHAPKNWNGRPVPFADIEAAAAYSKSIWPTLPTFVRTHPGFLKSAPFQWKALDAAWAQYSVKKGDIARYAQGNVRAAKALGLGLVFGLNVLDGGGGESGKSGYTVSRWAMSPDEVRRFGSVLAAEPYACGFFFWKYDKDDASYFADPGVQGALADVARVAANRSPAPCRVH